MYPNRWYSAADNGKKRRQNRTRWGCVGYNRIIFRIGTNMVRAKRMRWEAFKVINFSKKKDARGFGEGDFKEMRYPFGRRCNLSDASGRAEGSGWILDWVG